MSIDIIKECANHYGDIQKLVELAFRDEPYSDHKEHYLVDRIRKSSAYIPELTLVAIESASDTVVGFIMLSSISIGESDHKSLALAPVAVLPSHQAEGIGSSLIMEAHTRASAMGFDSIVLLGHSEYYPRFGYKQLSSFGISLPFDVPQEYAMAIELKEGSLRSVTGMVKYSSPFFE